MERRQRRHFSPREKVKILRLHLLEGRPVSAVCEEHGIHPTLFYQWQKAFFENGEATFERRKRAASEQREKILQLEGKLREKDEVLAEIAAEMVRLKKALGGS
jgi:transposase-like protein